MPSIRPSAKMFYFFSLKILCRGPPGRRSAKFELFKKKILCRVSSGRHSAKFEFFFKIFFAECPLAGTRQSLNFFFKKILCRVPRKWFSEHPFFQLCRVLWPWHSSATLGKVTQNGNFFIYFYIPSWQINSYNHISHPSHIYLIHHIYISSVHT